MLLYGMLGIGLSKAIAPLDGRKGRKQSREQTLSPSSKHFILKDSLLGGYVII